MPAKKIVAMFALAAQAQDAAPVVPGEVGERIFSDSLNGVSVENFLDAMTTDYESSYIYEEVVPDNNEYDLFSYDGTDGNDAGRPNGNDDYDGKELDASQLFGNDPNNTNQSAHIGKNSSHNECRQCSGLDFAACQSAGFETCNDAQDACVVQIRSEFQGFLFLTFLFFNNLIKRYFYRSQGLFWLLRSPGLSSPSFQKFP